MTEGFRLTWRIYLREYRRMDMTVIEFVFLVLLKIAQVLVNIAMYASAFNLINTATRGKFLNWLLSANVVVNRGDNDDRQ